MSSGLDKIALCALYFGESPRWMSNAFKWFCLRLYGRYYNMAIAYQALSREVHTFPYYATKISRRVSNAKFMVDNITGERYYSDCVHMNERDCHITLLIDGSVTENSTTDTGPNSNYYGLMRNDNMYLTQRVIYVGYKQLHGLSSLKLCLPTCIHCMYGLYSMQMSDRSMVNISAMNQFMIDIQTNNGNNQQDSAIYGEKLFTLSQCIYCARQGGRLNHLARQQELEYE